MFEALRKRPLTTAAIVTGVVVLAPSVLPTLSRVGRPLAKGALKAGVVAAERARTAVAELAEAGEDLLAEVRHELAREREAAEAAAAAAATANAETADAPPTSHAANGVDETAAPSAG